jgi:thiamine pyrophosphate-dependent acetolactate synthase large subunit-like protein
VCLDVEIQEAPVTAPSPAIRPAEPSAINPDSDAVNRAADWLVAAERPLAIADVAGRSSGAAPVLLRLAEHLSMPVVDVGGRFNIPTTHALDATDAGDDLDPPDVVLALEVTDPFGQLRRLPTMPDGAPSRIVNVGTRELGLRSWASHYQALAPADLSITSAVAPALEALLVACLRRGVPAGAASRAERLGERARTRRESWERVAEASGSDVPIAISWLMLRVREALAGRRWSFVNAPIENPWPRRLLRLEESWQWLGGSGGAGIGYAAGASVGAALALRDRDALAVGVLGDGDLLYTPGAIWTAVHERIPVLLVVANNRSYFNSENHALTMARQRSRPLERAAVGTRIVDPEVDFATLARSLGARGHGPVTDPATLGAILATAVEEVAAGHVVVVDVVTQAR